MQNIFNFLPSFCIPKYKRPYNTNELDISRHNESVFIKDESESESMSNKKSETWSDCNNYKDENIEVNKEHISHESNINEKKCYFAIIDCSK